MQILSDLWDKRQALAKFAERWLPAIMLVIGFVGLWLAYFHQSSDPQARAFWQSVAQIVLGAGVFSVTFKFFRSLDAVRQMVGGWLSDDGFCKRVATEICRHQSDPLKLLESADLEQQWRNLSIAITKNAFPDLSTQINKWVLDNVLPTKIEYYFKTYRKTFEITLEHNLLKVVHDIEARMKCRPNRGDVTFEMMISLAALQGRDPVVKFFSVDGQPVTVTLNKMPSTASVDGMEKWLLEAPVRIQGTSQLRVRYESYQDLNADPFLQLAVTRYVADLTYLVKYNPALLSARYADPYRDPVLRPDEGSQAGALDYRLPPGRLIFPGETLMFVVGRVAVPAGTEMADINPGSVVLEAQATR